MLIMTTFEVSHPVRMALKQAAHDARIRPQWYGHTRKGRAYEVSPMNTWYVWPETHTNTWNISFVGDLEMLCNPDMPWSVQNLHYDQNMKNLGILRVDQRSFPIHLKSFKLLGTVTTKDCCMFPATQPRLHTPLLTTDQFLSPVV